jgi:hypothetical protein
MNVTSHVLTCSLNHGYHVDGNFGTYIMVICYAYWEQPYEPFDNV